MAAQSVLKLKVDSSEYNSKIQRATTGLMHLSAALKESGKSFSDADKDQVAYIRELGKMETSTKSARGRVNELSKAFVELSNIEKNLTEQEKKSAAGQALSKSLVELKARAIESKKELAELNSQLDPVKTGSSGLSSVINELGGRFGISNDLMEMLTTGTVAYTAAIGGAVTAVAAATKQWADYNAELARQDQITTVTTGLKGGDADKMTDAARSISRVYGTDFREVINAANILMAQFGKTGDEAIQLLRDGMQGMIQGDGPKLLNMIQQYAPAFRDAGVSASQLVAVIQNSEGGLFTDQNMNAIVMGIKNIRLMTNATSEALGQLGINGEEMTRKLNDGSLSVFDALKQVASAVENTSSSSQAAGQVMQQVFGRQGAMAGTKLGEAIASLNLNLEETKTQTGEVGKSMKELELANERLDKALRETFGYDGWQTMANGIKTDLVGALASVLELTESIKNSVVGKIGTTIFDSIMSAASPVINTLKQVYNLMGLVRGNSGTGNGAPDNFTGPHGSFKDQSFNFRLPVEGVVVTATRPIKTGGSGGGGRSSRGGGRNTPAKTETPLPVGSVAALNKELSELRKQQELATSTEGWDAQQQKIDELTTKIKILKGEISDPTKIQQGKGQSVLGIGIGQAELDNVQKQLKAMVPDGGVKIPAKIEINTQPLEDVTKKGKDVNKAFSAAAQAVSSIGDAFNAIEDPSAKAAGMVLQAIASITLGFAQASAQPNTAGTGWGWLAWLAAGTAALATTISTVHSLTNLSEGGFVPGNAYSGDNIPANGGTVGLNSGELVLNRSQQNNLANALQGGPQGLDLRAVVSGEQIVLVANRSLKRRGKGELVTWK